MAVYNFLFRNWTLSVYLQWWTKASLRGNTIILLHSNIERWIDVLYISRNRWLLLHGEKYLVQCY